MGSNYIIENSFQMIRTNPLLSTNIQILVDSEYSLYLESINSHKKLSSDVYKNFAIAKDSLYEDLIPKFYNELPTEIAFYVKDDNDKSIVQKEYMNQYDSLYWSGAVKIKDNYSYKEEFEYFAPLYIVPRDIPDGFVILRVDGPGIYESNVSCQNLIPDIGISSTSKENFREQIIEKWKSVKYVDMTMNSPFGFWLNNNYRENNRFPTAPLYFNFKKYELTRWYGIEYHKGGYTNKSVDLSEKLYLDNPHFKLEELISNGFKNNSLVYPNIANFKFLFNDTPASPFEYKKYSLNRYFGFYVDLSEVKSVTPYRAKSLISGLKIVNNIFMLDSQITGSTMPFDIMEWDDEEKYYIYAKNNLYKVIKTVESGEEYYKILSDEDLDISDITRDYEVDILFNDLGNYEYENLVKSRNVGSIFIDKYMDDTGVYDMKSDLYLIKIDNNYLVLESRRNQYNGYYEHLIRTDYGIECDDKKLEYWLQSRTSEDSFIRDVEDKVNNDTPMIFKVFRVKFRDIKDFDFNRVDTGYANFDFNRVGEYSETSEQKLHVEELRDASETKVYKTYDKTSINLDKVINVSSEYLSTNELFEIDENGLTNIWDKNPSIVKWGYKGSTSHSNYPYKLNNSLNVGGVFNRTTDVISNKPNVMTKTDDYFYRIGNFYKSERVGNVVTKHTEYFDNQTLSIETDFLKTEYYDIDLYIDSSFDYFDYFFKNKRYFNKDGDYEQTSNFSMIEGNDAHNISNTLFKGIRYNFSSVKDIIRDENDFIENLIVNASEDFNGYKFSIILNTKYYSSVKQPLKCRKPLVYSYVSESCVCPNDNMVYDEVLVECICPGGSVLVNGECVCESPLVWNETYGECRCPDGSDPNDGECSLGGGENEL